MSWAGSALTLEPLNLWVSPVVASPLVPWIRAYSGLARVICAPGISLEVVGLIWDIQYIGVNSGSQLTNG